MNSPYTCQKVEAIWLGAYSYGLSIEATST